jgi:hypothetical protein
MEKLSRMRLTSLSFSLYLSVTLSQSQIAFVFDKAQEFIPYDKKKEDGTEYSNLPDQNQI